MGKILEAPMAIVDTLFSGLFGGDEKPQAQPVAAPAAPAPEPIQTPEAPKVTAPAPMPTPLPDDQAVASAKRRSIAAQVKRRGRASTILTDLSSNDTLG